MTEEGIGFDWSSYFGWPDGSVDMPLFCRKTPAETGHFSASDVTIVVNLAA
jgi:hypothetical protein